jgi:hypothetical protein
LISIVSGSDADRRSLMPLTDMAHTIEYQRDLPQDYCRALVVEFKSRHEKAVNLWFQPGGKLGSVSSWSLYLVDTGRKGSHVPQPGLSTEESQVLQWSALGPLLTVRQYALETASEADKEEAVDNCLRLSSSIVTQAEVVSQNGVLRYLQDVGARLLSTLSRFLHHVCTHSANHVATADPFTCRCSGNCRSGDRPSLSHCSNGCTDAAFKHRTVTSTHQPDSLRG